MIYESYFHTNHECYFMIHSELKSFKPTILFIHGLGDSSISYQSYLNSDLIRHYNILIPDLLGYGKSSSSSDYSFEHQVQGIEQHIHYLQDTLDLQLAQFILVAHSMGGIHATLLSESTLKKSIKAFINVEGSITQFGSFIATNMIHALKDYSFSEWFDGFKQNIYENITLQFPSLRLYYASLEFCNPTAFMNNAIQMHKMSEALTEKYTHIIGKKYAELTIPRVYCYGDSMCEETIEFLRENNLESRHFTCKNHFLLSECYNEFVIFIHAYAKKYV